MVNGSYVLYLVLEKEIVEFFNCFIVIVFLIGYIVNLGVISVFVDYNVVVLLDVDSYVSIYDVCFFGGVEIICFCYNDVKDLEWCMVCFGEWVKEVIIIVEGIYSMFGDVVLLVEIVDIKCCFGGYLIVDEVYLFGVLGVMGCGLVEVVGVEDDVDIIVGIFSKSLVLIGGFVVGLEVMEVLCYGSCLYIFIVFFFLFCIVIVCLLLRIIVI